MTSLLETLLDDVLLEVISYLDVSSILRLRRTSRRLQQITLLRVAWIGAYNSSLLPLPDQPSDPEEIAGFDYEKRLIQATRLHYNWASSSPLPSRVQVLHDVPASATWLFKSRFLLMMAGNQIVCWDLGLQHRKSKPRLVWGETLRGRSPTIEVAPARVGESEGLLIAYASDFPKGSSQLFSSFEEDGSCSPPKVLPFIDTAHEVKTIGMNDSELALACSDGTLVLYNVSSRRRRCVSMTEETVPIWIQTIKSFEDFVLVARYRNRSVVLDAYHVPPSIEDESDTTKQPGSVHLLHAQTTSISSCEKSTSATDGNPIYTFQVLASFSDCIKCFQLTIVSEGLHNPPEVSLQLVGDDHPTIAGQSREPHPSPEIEDESSGDEYDSDSTANRISHPLQVMDMALGASGSRAVVIPISSRTNDRTLWGYTKLENGSLLRRPWKFLNDEDSTEAESLRGSDTESTEPYRDLLRRHACRVLFDEVSGKVVVAADCQLIVIFDFGVLEDMD
ncbi:hypothetical protein FRC03_000256 [Tulasnella sp. 419]|nr:hypothetical protein FRC03_000256 [Tulasnella sp. 419]